MKLCPNCGRPTARTEDWVCQWCGYPLLAHGYRRVPKSYQQLQEEKRPPLEPPGRHELPPEAGAPGVITAEPAPAAAPAATVTPGVAPAAGPKPAPKRKPRKTAKKATAKAAAETGPAAAPEAGPEAAPEPEPLPVPGTVAEAATGVAAVVEEPLPETVAGAAPEAAPLPRTELLPAPPVIVPDFSADIVEVNAAGLSAVFHGNKAEATEKLAGKTVRATGTVDRIVVNGALNIYYVLLTSGDPQGWNVRATFNEQNGLDLKQLVKGYTVTLQGKYSGYERNILLKDCFIVH